ncbi:MAG: InlB B-repeat-containing protein [Firmicutes bacterium]|nr:InlB B-repeat-containing protein [Bacillota bacterium]
MKNKSRLFMSLLMILSVIFFAACEVVQEVEISFVTGTNQSIESITREVGLPYGELPVPENKYGHTFAGWWNDPVEGSFVIPDSIVANYSDHTLYARWSLASITINFATGTNQTMSPITRTFGATYGSLPIPTRNNHSFYGWWTQQSGGTRVVESTVVQIGVTHTLFARWESYTVINLETGTKRVFEPIARAFGTAYGILPRPQRQGHTFDGWWTCSEGGELVTSETIVATSQTHTLYARWTFIGMIKSAWNGGVAIDSDGRLWTWGRANTFYQGVLLGDGTTVDRLSPSHIMPNTRFTSISINNYDRYAIDTYGNLWAWGQPNATFSALPTKIMEGTKFYQVSSSYAIDIEGNLWAWGRTHIRGILQEILPSPTKIMEGTKFSFINTRGNSVGFAVDIHGNVYGWGDARDGRNGLGVNENRLSQQITRANQFSNITSINAGSGGAAIDKNGRLLTWGTNTHNQLGDGTTTMRLQHVHIMQNRQFVQVNIVDSHANALDTEGNIWAWGRIGSGIMGCGTTGSVTRSVPVHIAQGTSFSFVFACGLNGRAICVNGNFWSWGEGFRGSIGDGTNMINRSFPVQITLEI